MGNQRIFLEIIRGFLHPEESMPDTSGLDRKDWEEILVMASEHALLPVVYDMVWKEESFQKLPQEIREQSRKNVKAIVAMQVQRTQIFLQIYQNLKKEGITPLVIKGIICRNLYRVPDCRVSSDEDILVRNEEFIKVDRLLCSWGFQRDPVSDIRNAYEAGYTNAAGMRLEVHRALFEEEEGTFGDMVREFSDVFEHTAVQETEGVTIHTLDAEYHLCYLLCHGLKHFALCGFGIRQLADMLLFAETYGRDMDWHLVEEKMKRLNLYVFWMNLFDIGEKYLGFSWDTAALERPDPDLLDSDAMLADIIDAGIFGKRSSERLHSAGITVQALRGKRRLRIIPLLFPSPQYIMKKYPEIADRKWLLPAAWFKRIIEYAKIHRISGTVKTVRTGSERTRLLKKYGIFYKR